MPGGRSPDEGDALGRVGQRLTPQREHVGLGLDYIFDTRDLAAEIAAHPDKFPPHLGYTADIAMTAPEQLPALADELARRGVDDASLARIFGGNWLRVAREVWQPPF